MYTDGLKAAGSLLGMSPHTVEEVLELAGLGALAAPAAYELAVPAADQDETTHRLMAGTELGGLGLLAAPPIMKLLR